MNAIDRIEHYLGEPLSEESAARFLREETPLDHVIALVDALSQGYYDWLENEEERRRSAAPVIYHPINPYPRSSSLDDKLQRYKAFLLYFPTVSLPDPVAEAIWPVCMMSNVARMFGDNTIPFTEESERKLRSDLHAALKLLASLHAFVDEGNVTLIPGPFALDYSAVQQSARDELKALKEDEEALQRYDGIDEGLLGSVKVWCKVCSLCQYTPVAGRDWVSNVLTLEHQQAPQRLKRVAGIDMRVAPNLFEHKLPGFEKASFEDVAKLRKNEEAFADWRNTLATILEQVAKEEPVDEPQFEVDFQRSAQVQLTPKLQAINAQVTESEVLSKMLIPGGLTLAGGAITYAITNQPFVATAVSAALTPVSWIADRIIKRFNRLGRKAAVLRDFYGYLAERRR